MARARFGLFCVFVWVVLLLSLSALAQQPVPPAPPQPGAGQTASAVESLRPGYMLGPADQILLRGFEVEGISERSFTVDGDGDIDFPLLGRVKAGGLTVEQLEKTLAERARTYVREPQIRVTVVRYRSEPVFVVGAFRTPGIYPLLGRRTLVEMVSSIGGLLPNASRRIRLARRKEFGPIPLPKAVESTDGKATTVSISMGSQRENVDPAEDIALQPFDVITADRAEMIYVNGEVLRVGPVELGERDSMSIIQLLTVAGGMTRDANPAKARVLRPVLNTSRRAEIPLDLRRILEGKDSDFPLMANDLLYVPRGASFKRNLGRGLLVAIPSATAIAYIIQRR